MKGAYGVAYDVLRDIEVEREVECPWGPLNVLVRVREFEGQGDAKQEVKWMSYLLGIAPKLSAGDFSMYFPVLTITDLEVKNFQGLMNKKRITRDQL
jgi:hypothetical protein